MPLRSQRGVGSPSRDRLQPTPRTRVALLVTCLVDTVYPAVGKATGQMLERLGVEVHFPTAQTCCGQAQVGTG